MKRIRAAASLALKKAEAELGDKFDLRDFHAQVLMLIDM